MNKFDNLSKSQMRYLLEIIDKEVFKIEKISCYENFPNIFKEKIINIIFCNLENLNPHNECDSHFYIRVIFVDNIELYVYSKDNGSGNPRFGINIYGLGKNKIDIDFSIDKNRCNIGKNALKLIDKFGIKQTIYNKKMLGILFLNLLSTIDHSGSDYYNYYPEIDVSEIKKFNDKNDLFNSKYIKFIDKNGQNLNVHKLKFSFI
ncbi:hypothetical protein QLL95_gp0364 [Cotonvirus japonicus]|uniref:Uncharacterized protein n=1 Tax=Cotonvirus japonicus TaxID=2811091 RepID=A0ABM7NUF0_9VIRU|nr:hypothetical protein QLL95_gp0364 [Cotonvirus japonicus]BCS83759.1 hypothetical protein [Cotonvirus japonicus]